MTKIALELTCVLLIIPVEGVLLNAWFSVLLELFHLNFGLSPLFF